MIDSERLEQIDARLVEIRSLAETAENVVELKAEAEKLAEERKQIQDKIEARKKLLEQIPFIKADHTEKAPEERKSRMDNAIITPESAEYRTYWLKNLQQNLTEAEKRSGESWSIAQAGGAIPTVTSGLFLEKMKQVAPILNEISLYHVPGNFSIGVEGTRNVAAIHTQNALISPSDDTTTVVTLGGYEIAKLVRVSKSVQKMSVDEFERFIVETLGGDIARLIESKLITGNGTTEPKGIEEAYATWTNDTNGVQWASSDSPTAAELMELIGYLEGSYAGNAKFLMNHKTFWNKIMALRDDSKFPVVNVDGQVKRLMGFPVLFSSYVPDYTMYFGDFKKAVIANFNEEVNIARSEHSGFGYNAVDFRASCIFDSKIAMAEALVKGATSIA